MYPKNNGNIRKKCNLSEGHRVSAIDYHEDSCIHDLGIGRTLSEIGGIGTVGLWGGVDPCQKGNQDAGEAELDIVLLK